LTEGSSTEIFTRMPRDTNDGDMQRRVLARIAAETEARGGAIPVSLLEQFVPAVRPAVIATLGAVLDRLGPVPEPKPE
jgi:hypothetical protein